MHCSVILLHPSARKGEMNSRHLRSPSFSVGRIMIIVIKRGTKLAVKFLIERFENCGK